MGAMRESRAARVEIRLLGEFGVWIDGRAIPPSAWQLTGSADIVKILSLAPQYRLAREALVEALWGRADAEAGSAALQKTIAEARAVLAASDVLVAVSREIALAPGAEIDTDLEQFERAAQKALAGRSKELCASAAALYGGELLPADRLADWAEARRESARALHRELLRRSGTSCDDVELETSDERAQLALIRLYAESGNRTAALRQFRLFREALAKKLGAAPSSEAIELYESLSRGPATSAPSSRAERMMGREGELTQARALLRRAAAGQGGILLVRGEAGSGKTRFCEELLAEAASDGSTSLRGGGGHASFCPVVEPLDRLLRSRPDLAQHVAEPARQTVARLAGVAPRWPDAYAERPDRQLVFSAVAQPLTLAARERPVLLFIDDLHALDDSTIELLHYLATMARFERILLVAAIRPEARAELERLRDGAHEIELAAVAAPEPESLAPLSGDLRAMLERAAVLGDAFLSEQFFAFAALPETAALELLQALRKARLLDTTTGGFRFRRTLLREAVLRELPEERRRELEAEAALARSRTGGSARSIAHHLQRAGRDDQAAEWLVQAAYDERGVAAHASALRCLEHALERREPEVELLALRADLLLATGAGEAASAFEQAVRRARGARREQLCIQWTEAQLALGDTKAAAHAYSEIGDVGDLHDRVRKLVLGAELDWLRGDLDGAERRAEQGLSFARALGPGRALSDAVQLRSLLAHRRGRWPDHVRAQMLDADRVRELSASIHEGQLCGAQAYLYGAGSYAKVAVFAQELLSAAERAGTRRAIAFALCLLGESELLTGELTAARQHLDRSVRLSLELGSTGAAALATTRLAETALYHADYEQARSLLGAALELARRSPHCRRHLLHRVYGVKARGAYALQAAGVVAEAEVAIRGRDETCTSCAITFAIPASIACARDGEIGRARHYLSSAELCVQTFWRGTTWDGALDEARAAVATAAGERERASDLLVQAARTFTRGGQKLDAERCRQGREAL